MGANPTQAIGVLLFFTGSTLIAIGAATGGSASAVLLGLTLIAAAAAAFLKCKPWEHE